MSAEEIVQSLQGLFMARVTDYSQGNELRVGHWDCVPPSLTCPVTQQPVVVVTEAATREINAARLWHSFKYNPNEMLKLFSYPLPHPLQRRWITGCLGDCCHCVTNGWIINQNTQTHTHTVSLKLWGSVSQSAALPQEPHHFGNQGAHWKQKRYFNCKWTHSVQTLLVFVIINYMSP